MDKKSIIMIIVIILILIAIVGISIYIISSNSSSKNEVQNYNNTTEVIENGSYNEENISNNELDIEKSNNNEIQVEEEINTMSKVELNTTTYNVNGVEFKMILVEAGTFTMGSNDTNVGYSESPAHTATLTNDYLIGETEVTEALWNTVMNNTNGDNTMPKTSITWQQAHTFIDKLNEIAHEKKIIDDNVNFILPTEAQWEYAAKGGNKSKGYKYSGSNNINDVAVTRENSGSNSPIEVKTKKPNELGIYDMSGNAYEWVDDYASSYSAGAQVDPQNTTKSSSYVKRGGSNYHNFSSESYLFTTTGRYFYGSTDWTIGFRIALQ